MRTENLTKASLAVMLIGTMTLAGCAKGPSAASPAKQPAATPALSAEPTADEILAYLDAQEAAVKDGADKAPVIDAPDAVIKPDPTKPVSVAETSAKPAPKPVAEQPQAPAKPTLGTKACPAAPLKGKWMSTEVRQGAKNELIPVAIGYMFREDGYFATALFDLASGEKQGEFEGTYRTKQDAAGKCVISFDVPSASSKVNDLRYTTKSGKLIISDQQSQSKATLGRI